MNRHPLLNIVKDKPGLSRLADEFGTPLYVYSGNRLKENLDRLDGALRNNFRRYRICYAVKANSNPLLLQFMRAHLPTLAGDCSSPGELAVVRRAGYEVRDCIYTGNYESPGDLKAAVDAGCHINLDDITSFRRLAAIGLPGEISFRLNPGFGKGAFSQITTAGEKAKFGIPKETILQAYSLARDHGVRQFGLQCMAGSGVLDIDYFGSLLTAILETAQNIEAELNLHFNYISMGGGFGIPYKDEETSLDIDKLFKNLGRIFYSFYSPDDKHTPALWVEPGKYLVGDAALLLTRVTGTKNSYRKFIGVDAGMETFMRPALYNAYHRIYKVGEPNAPNVQTVDITGRICENTDRLAVDRPFPETTENDLLAVMDVGAYGFSMAHQFNARPRPAEVLLDDSGPRLIRRRETIEELFQNCDI
ncbi:MAG: diaminopimelate decarboxylase [FCB group bacterium]|nr:diaminopimelate decarboxylase [FCB group bacterium]